MFGLFGIGDEQRPTRREEYDGHEYQGGPDSTKGFTIDGKSWDYRDPANFNDGQDKASDKHTYNRDAYEMTNPLYEYSYGQMRDAAKSLGIQNVDEKNEVDKLLNYMQNPPTATESKKVKKQKANKPDIPEYMDPAKPIQLSNSAAKDEATVSAWDQRFDSGLAQPSTISYEVPSTISYEVKNNQPSQAAFDLKNDYSLNLQSGMGTRGQTFTFKHSGGWDGGISQQFLDNRKKLIADNLQPGWNQSTMGA